MKARAMIKAALRRSGEQGTGATKIIGEVPVPVAVGQGDDAMIFRAYLLTLAGGQSLARGFDKMIMSAPMIASQVIQAGGLGEISRGRAVRSIMTYMEHGVAVAPLGL